MKRFVIPNIHGCSKTLSALLDKIGLTQADEIYFLGDFIDRGKDSAGVLDTVIELIDHGYKVYPIRGNHEQNLLYAYEKYNPKMFAAFVGRFNKSKNLLDEDGRIIEKYLQFMKSLPYYYELEDYWIVHAGFNTRTTDFLQDHLAMLEIRKFDYNEALLKGKRVVHGHQVTYEEVIKRKINEREMILPLDNGCIYNAAHKKYDYLQTGNLNCLDLDNLILIKMKNID